jgi:hypothetical protein
MRWMLIIPLILTLLPLMVDSGQADIIEINKFALNPFCVGGCRVYFYGLYDGWGCCLTFWPYLYLRPMLLGF